MESDFLQTWHFINLNVLRSGNVQKYNQKKIQVHQLSFQRLFHCTYVDQHWHLIGNQQILKTSHQ